MNCADAEAALARLGDNDLELVTAHALWLHLATCIECCELLAQLLLLRALCRVAEDEWEYKLEVRPK